MTPTATRLVVVTQDSNYDIDTEEKYFRRSNDFNDNVFGTDEWVKYISLVQLEIGRPMIIHYQQGDKLKARVSTLVVDIKEPEEG